MHSSVVQYLGLKYWSGGVWGAKLPPEKAFVSFSSENDILVHVDAYECKQQDLKHEKLSKYTQVFLH